MTAAPNSATTAFRVCLDGWSLHDLTRAAMEAHDRLVREGRAFCAPQTLTTRELLDELRDLEAMTAFLLAVRAKAGAQLGAPIDVPGAQHGPALPEEGPPWY